MHDVLVAGLAEPLAAWIERRVVGVAVHRAGSVDEVRDAILRRAWSLVILDHRVSESASPSLLSQLRDRPARVRAPIIYTLERDLGEDVPARLVAEFGVSQLLFHPLDRDEVAHQVATTLGLAPRPVDEGRSPPNTPMTAAIGALWNRFKGANLDRVAALENAAALLARGQLDLAARRSAEREAHKLAGAVGTFGFSSGSSLAREIERLLDATTSLQPADAARLLELATAVRRDLERDPGAFVDAAPAPSGGPSLLIVDGDRDVLEQLALAASGQGMRVETALTLTSARDRIARDRPSAVLLSLSFRDSTEEGLALLAELNAMSPPVPVMVLTARDEFADRLEVARLGGRGFLRKSLPPSHVIEAVAQMLNRLHADDSNVLAVDDDPQVLEALRVVLGPCNLKLTTLDDPLRFWDQLRETAPDLVVLDVDMPHLSGIELCRVMRNDARWSNVPVLFLTAQTDPAAVCRVFAAGADDYVAKPIVGPELIARITNRLERVWLYRTMAETDFLTGVANPRKASQVLEQLLGLATRHHQPLCLAIADLDHFKQVNDSHGHATGDAVLRHVGELLLRRFRGADLVARWGGEEFLLGMYGMTCDDARQRLADALESLRGDVLADADGCAFSVTCSAGVAQYPLDGTEFLALYRAADQALYRAKAAGRDRVFAAVASSVGTLL